MSEPESPKTVEPEADHVSYTLDMPLEQIERLEREKAAMMREHQKVPMAARIAVEAEPAFGDPSKLATPAVLAQPPVIGVNLDGGRIVLPTAERPTVEKPAEGPQKLVIPDRTAEAIAAQASTQAMPKLGGLEVAGGRAEGSDCSNRCDVRNGGSAFYHCHACLRHWREGKVVARGPQRMTVAG